MFKQYLHSFRWHKDLWFSFIVDIVTSLILFLTWFCLGKLLTVNSYQLSNGRSVEELKLALLSSPELSQTFASNLRWFVILMIGGTVLAIILSVIIFSLSRQLIWSNKLNSPGKWVRMTFTLGIIFVVYSGIFILVKLLINSLLIDANGTLVTIVNNLLGWTALLIWLIFMFVVYHSFVKEQAVGKTISNSLQRIKQKKKDYGQCFFYSLVTVILLMLILTLINKKFYWFVLSLNKWISSLILLLIILAYIAWMRTYVSKI